jgi:hypothetical protein
MEGLLREWGMLEYLDKFNGMMCCYCFKIVVEQYNCILSVCDAFVCVLLM